MSSLGSSILTLEYTRVFTDSFFLLKRPLLILHFIFKIIGLRLINIKTYLHTLVCMHVCKKYLKNVFNTERKGKTEEWKNNLKIVYQSK